MENNEELLKYADLLLSMSLDFKTGKISGTLYKDNLNLIIGKINTLEDE